MSFSCSLLALAAGVTIAGQLASAHRSSGRQIVYERLDDHATRATGNRLYGTFKGTLGELKQRDAATDQVPIEFASSASYDKQPSLTTDANLIKIVKLDGGSRVVGAGATDTIADLKKIVELEDNPFIVQRPIRGDQELQDDEQVANSFD